MIWRALSVAYLTSTVGFAVFAQDLRIPAVPLGDLEPSEMRLTLTAQELQDMGIPDVHAFGFDQTFAVGDLSEIDQVGVSADVSVCFTCGGHWPREAGAINAGTGRPNHERGRNCSGFLRDRVDRRPRICAQEF
jgi:hypothetical protein